MFYEKVVKYCKKEKLSISGFEKKCGIGNGTISRWKNDSSKPTLETLEKIAVATGTKLSDWII